MSTTEKFIRARKGMLGLAEQLNNLSAVDADGSLGFAKLYLSKVPVTADDVLDDRLLPYYEEHAAEVEHLLTDNGREYCSREFKHHFELLLAMSQIRHRRTELRCPQTCSDAIKSRFQLLPDRCARNRQYWYS